jgi:hypothetical protein
VFAVVWYRNGRTYWAALHDFSSADREQLVEMCRGLDHCDGQHCLGVRGSH